ncbi:hypothetical protein [Haladaptatus halobius]|uniref:hypothetical protein n=1 Tax=Haladaptatus halobius TaxID=2884875 RepID=UPI001D0B1B9D|nr:hypothetical protein [Haladaptatus halobius]
MNTNIALGIPPIAVLIKMLRRSKNLAWRYQQASLVLALSSIALFLTMGGAVFAYLLLNVRLSPLLMVALAFTVLGLVPFALFTGILYKEHKMTFGS